MHPHYQDRGGDSVSWHSISVVRKAHYCYENGEKSFTLRFTPEERETPNAYVAYVYVEQTNRTEVNIMREMV